MFLSDLSIKRPIMISMLLIALTLFGGIAYFGLNLERTRHRRSASSMK